MQVPHQMVWPQMMTSGEHYVTATPQSVVIPPPLAQDNLVHVPIVLKNNWLVPGISPVPHPTSYLPQTLQYVTMQPRMVDTGGAVEKHLAPPSDHLLTSQTVLMTRRPVRGNDIICGRSLRGCNFATRRRSEEKNDELPNKKASIETRAICRKESGLTDGSCHMDRDGYILQAVEYYLSDENLAKNAYLLKQVLQDDGYISLKRITALKRVKLFTRDDQVVAQCIRRSKKLELNQDGTMVRRRTPLPPNIEPPRFVRSVIAINLPMATPSIEAVTSLFAVYGDLTQVRILRPGKKLPPYLSEYQAWIPDLGKKFCALVEFENQEEAQNACREINVKNRSNHSLRVALLKPGARLRRTLYRKYKDSEDTQESSESQITNSALKPASAPDPTHEYDASCSESELGSQADKSMPTHSASDSGYSPTSDHNERNACTNETDFDNGLFVPCSISVPQETPFVPISKSNSADHEIKYPSVCSADGKLKFIVSNHS